MLNSVQLGVQMLLDDRANPGFLQAPAGSQSHEARDDQHQQLAAVAPAAPQQLAGEEPEDHRGERRNETQREVAAAVEDKRLFTREEI